MYQCHLFFGMEGHLRTDRHRAHKDADRTSISSSSFGVLYHWQDPFNLGNQNDMRHIQDLG